MTIPQPNYTQVPNRLLELMPDMKESELKVTLAIARQTFGWHRERRRLSLSQLVAMTGITKKSVSRGIQAGIERGTIGREGTTADGQDGYEYYLIIEGHEEETQPQGVGEILHHPSGGRGNFTPQVVQNLPQGVGENLHTLKEREEINLKKGVVEEPTPRQPARQPATAAKKAHDPEIPFLLAHPTVQRHMAVLGQQLKPDDMRALIETVTNPEVFERVLSDYQDHPGWNWANVDTFLDRYRKQVQALARAAPPSRQQDLRRKISEIEQRYNAAEGAERRELSGTLLRLKQQLARQESQGRAA